MAKHKIPEPWLVCLPKLLIAKLKMVGNMIELHKPTSNIATIAKVPDDKMVIIISTIDTSELKNKTLPAGIFCITSAPIKRPTIARPNNKQYILPPLTLLTLQS